MLLDHHAHYALTRTHLWNQAAWASVAKLAEESPALPYHKPYHSPPWTIVIVSLSCYTAVYLSVLLSDRSLTWSGWKISPFFWSFVSNPICFNDHLMGGLKSHLYQPAVIRKGKNGVGASLDFISSFCLRSHHLITPHPNSTHGSHISDNTPPAAYTWPSGGTKTMVTTCYHPSASCWSTSTLSAKFRPKL